MPQPAQHQQVTQQQKPHSTPTTETSLERHARKCAICRHPDREAIEEQFVHWRSPEYTTNYYHLGDRRVLYRHAQATGLYEQRRRNYLFTIENILECGEEIQLTASAYIKAVRAYACLCDTVRWSKPVTRVLHEYSVRTDSAAPPPVSEPIPLPQSSTDSAGVSSPLPPQAAVDSPVPAKQAPSAIPEGRPADQEQSVPLPSSTLPEAAFDNPARSAPPRAETTSAAGAPCGSGLQPRHNARRTGASFRERLEGRGSASTPLQANSLGCAPKEKSVPVSSPLLPPAAVDAPARSAASNARATDHESRATSPSSNSEEKSCGASSVPPTSVASNRHIPELESGLSHRKQTSEVLSNRHKITK